MLATKPIAYFPLGAPVSEASGLGLGSLAGGYQAALQGGAQLVAGGPIGSLTDDYSLSLSGSAYASTTFAGGIPGKGSMVAWVNLATLPSQTGNYFYVCGESQSGNDFDLQFQNDNMLYFYTGGGESTSYAPPVNALVGQWNMIAVTYVGGNNGSRNIYWNGALVSRYSGGVDSNPKTQPFSIGASTVFGNRYFQGQLGEVAVWNYPLTAKEIAALYKASQ